MKKEFRSIGILVGTLIFLSGIYGYKYEEGHELADILNSITGICFIVMHYFDKNEK